MLNEILITLTVCIDTYLMAVNYTSSRIKIPFLSGAILSLISSLILYISLMTAKVLEMIIPAEICSVTGFVILTAIGTLTILKTIIRGIVKKMSERGDIDIKMSRLGIGVRLYLDETTADSDYSKVLSITESIALALALSIDSMAVGINAGFLGASALRTALLTFAINIISIYLGEITGKYLSSSKYDLSWLGGILLIAVAVIGIL